MTSGPSERYTRRSEMVPAKRGKPVVGAALIILLLAGAWYLLRRAPVRGSGGAATAGSITTNSATITWKTDQASASQVEYGTTSGYGSLSAFGSAPVTSHSVNLTALSPGTTYNYATLSTDGAGKVGTSGNFTFTTAGGASGGVAGIPNATGAPVISQVTVGSVTSNSATITWTTDQPLTSQAEYGATPAYGSLSIFSSSPVTSHSVVLTALTPGTTYNYAVLSTNSTGRTSASANSTFSTTSVAVAPAITNVTASAAAVNSVKITWTTDQPSSSQVEFGGSPAYGYLSAFSAPLVTSHSVTLPGLNAGKMYNYAALSVNSAGQVGTSSNFTLTAASAAGAPGISNVTATGITTSSATITWSTDQPSASQVEYGTTEAYGGLSVYSAPLVTAHKVVLTALTPGKVYNYAPVSANATGQVGKSPNSTFTTVAGPPVIRDIKVDGITGSSAIISWTTDQPSTSQVEYGTTTALWVLLHRRRRHDSLSPLDPSLVTSHSVILKGLTPDTTYDYAALSSNSIGMQNLSPSLRFSTSAGHARLETPGSGFGVHVALIGLFAKKNRNGISGSPAARSISSVFMVLASKFDGEWV